MRFYTDLSNQELASLVPSAFAIQPYHKQSDKYAFIPTSAVINGMRDAGFVPVMASQSRTRIEDKKDFTKHMIRFRSLSALSQPLVGDSLIEVVLINSHDGTSAYKLMCGVFRLVCSNGMVVADSLLESLRIRHTGNVIQEAIEGTQRIYEQAPKVLDAIQTWQGIELSVPEQEVLAISAHAARFADVEGNTNTDVTPNMLLAPRRRQDEGKDLWSTFNRIQENTTKGFRKYVSEHGRATRVTSRAITSIDTDVRLNRALWMLSEGMAKLKASKA